MPKLIIANWKSHKNAQEAEAWIEQYSQTVIRHTSHIVVCPAFPLLSTVADAIEKTQVQLSLGIQTLSPYPAGSYTGGVSVRNVEGLSIRYAILGHSERRQYFHETSNDVSKQVEQALSAGITPIVCVDKDYITSQAVTIADNLKAKCIIAYEPASAIGSGSPESSGTVQQVMDKIKSAFGEVKTIYGGSVNPDNISEYLTICDGVLVGSASLDVQTFAQMVAKIE